MEREKLNTMTKYDMVIWNIENPHNAYTTLELINANSMLVEFSRKGMSVHTGDCNDS